MTPTPARCPRAWEAAQLVRRFPGLPMYHTAVRVGPHKSTFYGYRTVRRAIHYGWIRVETETRGRNSVHRLYPVD